MFETVFVTGIFTRNSGRPISNMQNSVSGIGKLSLGKAYLVNASNMVGFDFTLIIYYMSNTHKNAQ